MMSEVAGPVRGIVLRDRRDAIVVRATEAEVRRFGHGAEVQVAPVEPARPTYVGALAELLQRDRLLYDHRGVPVAIVTGYRVESHPLEVTGLGDVQRTFVAGRSTVRITAEGLV